MDTSKKKIDETREKLKETFLGERTPNHPITSHFLLFVFLLGYIVLFYYFIPTKVIGSNNQYTPYSTFTFCYFILSSLFLALLLMAFRPLTGKSKILGFINEKNEPDFIRYGFIGMCFQLLIFIIILCCIERKTTDLSGISNNFIYIFLPLFTVFILLYAVMPKFINYFLYFSIVGTFVYIVYAIEVLLFLCYQLVAILPKQLYEKFPEVFNTIQSFFTDFVFKPFTLLFKTINDKLKTDEEFKFEFNKQMKQTGIFSMFFLFVVLVIFYAKNDNRSTSNMMYFYTFLIIIPIIVGLYVSSLLGSANGTSLYTRLFILSAAVVVFGVAYCYSNQINTTNNIFMYSLGNLFLLLMIIVFLGAAFIIFSNYLKKQRGVLGFIVNLIFFIPCLVTDLIQYIKEQIGITPNIVYILFIIELLLIISYIYLPSMIKFILQKNSTKLQEKPLYLNNENKLADGNSDFLKIDELDKGEVYNNNYAISFWLYLNPDTSFLEEQQSTNILKTENEKVIFNFANGRPKLVYINDEAHNDVYRFYLSNKCENNCTSNDISTQILEMNGFPKQRWNLFVINYTSNTSDIFVNGELKGSIEFTGANLPKDISPNNILVVGEENGLNGAIKETYYYNKPLTKFEIVNMYNIFNTFDSL